MVALQSYCKGYRLVLKCAKTCVILKPNKEVCPIAVSAYNSDNRFLCKETTPSLAIYEKRYAINTEKCFIFLLHKENNLLVSHTIGGKNIIK